MLNHPDEACAKCGGSLRSEDPTEIQCDCNRPRPPAYEDLLWSDGTPKDPEWFGAIPF
jgi:hypothetical protein